MDIASLYEKLSLASTPLSTDSRSMPAGAIYVALKGENFDGNTFTQDALNKGASFAIVSDAVFSTHDQCTVVEDTLATLQALATYHRTLFSIPVFAIGGSNGKTTTKELVHAVLSTTYNTHVTSGNLNNEIGVPLTILGINNTHEIAIIEIGANHPREHTILLDIVAPTHVLVTNNGADHLEGFKTLSGVRSANKEIYTWAEIHGAHAFVPHFLDDLVIDSDALERTLYPSVHHKSLSLLYASLQYNGVEYSSKLFGSFNEANILAAIAVGEHFSVTKDAIQQAIALYTPTLKRSQLIKTDTYSLILDCYNANPTSMALSLTDFFTITPQENRIVIIGDMLELGEAEHQAHKDMLDLIYRSYDPANKVICVGPRCFAWKDEFHSFHFFETTDEAREYFTTLDLTDAFIFVKASRGIKLEDVIKEKILL